MSRKIPEKWQSSVKAIKAVQVAFDMDEKIQLAIRKEALEAGLSPSDQIRDILGLPINKRPKRPRLTVSLAPDDYLVLAEKYQLLPEQQLEIKKKLMDDLILHITDKNN
jgi:predicted Co/Zn/Cd cation transporter (cation efflux family)